MLTIIKSSSNQDCLAVSGERTPVLFGFSLVSGCKFRVPSTKNCTLLSETILGVLRGREFPQYVASFGNSKPQNVLDWVQIKTETSVMGCNIPLSLDIIVQWTKYGSLVNPQAQIVSVTEKINSFSLNGPTAGRIMQISSSVSFVDVSAAAQAGYKAPPTIDAKLPFNFFFPFV
ncbi:TECT1 protein, partial [Polyodon spathula]|nr:TECT1 protein [Polyodon spathula]